jgi:hypothetical protein
MRIHLLVALLFATPLSGWGQEPVHPVRPSGCHAPPVPEVWPDAIAPEVYSAGRIGRSPFITGDLPRDVVMVEFVEGVTRAELQQAADAVCGQVVGGHRLSHTLALRVADDPQARVVFGAIEVLRGLPQVLRAYPELLGIVAADPPPRISRSHRPAAALELPGIG